MAYLAQPLYVKDVSSLFLEMVRDHLEIAIVATPGQAGDYLNWGLNLINPHELENRYVAYLIANHSHGKNDEPRHTKRREVHLRERFRDYAQKLTLFRAPETKFHLDAVLAEKGITVSVK